MGLRHRMLAVCFRKSQALALQSWCIECSGGKRRGEESASGDNSRGRERDSGAEKERKRKKGIEKKGPCLI